ncbi:MAG: hypothetical protein II563_07540, partial [Treponema sp.]|nr:hypothetical protein [Treponema sp.]
MTVKNIFLNFISTSFENPNERRMPCAGKYGRKTKTQNSFSNDTSLHEKKTTRVMDKLQRLSKRKFLALDFPASRARIFLEF